MSRRPFAMSAHAMRVLETIQSAGPIPLRDIDARCGDAPGETLRGTTISLMRTGHLGAAMSSGNKVREYFLTAKGRSALRREPDLSGPLRVAGPREAAFSGCYVGSELLPYTGRPGANQALALPSRMGSRLHYRDGTVVTTDHGNAKTDRSHHGQ